MSLLPSRFVLRVGAIGGVALLIAGCASFGRDELASLKAEVLDEPATTLAVASVDAPPEIPPLRPGELQPPPGGTGSGLGVLGVAPQGEEVDPSQVAVVFDRPMVALDAIEATSAKVPIRCSPSIQGRVRWAGTSTAVIIPEGNRFPMGTAYDCEVPAGTAAADGTTLEEAVRWTFATERPALEQSRPYAGSSSWDPKDPIVLRFNQPVDPAQIAGSVHLKTDDGRNVPLKLARGEGKQDRPDVVLARGSLTPDTGYVLTLDAGLRGTGGPLGLASGHTVEFRTYPPLRVDHAGPTGDAVSPLDPLELRFTTDVDAAEVNKRVRITPAPPDGFKPGDAYESTSWTYWTRLAPRTTYTVALDAGLVDTHGQKLAEGRTWSFTTGDLPAMVDAPEGFQVYPANNPRELPIRHRNVSRVDVRLAPVDVGEIVFGDGWRKWRDQPGGMPTELVPTTAANKVGVSTIDLSPALSPGGHGLVRVVVSAPEVRDWSGDVVESTSLLQVTDLGATLKLAPDGATVWVTRLSDGTPVPDAAVQLVLDGQVRWQGGTDREGLAVAQGDLVPDGWSSWREPLWVVVRAGDDVAVTNHQWDSGLEGWSHGVSSSFDPVQASLRVASFTDRGVYRPGDTAHVQITAREASLGGLAVPSRRALTWAFKDPNGQQLASGKGETDEYGTWSTDLALPSDGALGEHSLEVTVKGGGRSWVWIPVKAYRAPAFRTDVKAPVAALVGGTLTATAEGRYLFGAPMKGAKATWTIGREPLSLSPAGWEEFSFDALPDFDAWADRPGYESVSSGAGELDADGRLSIAQPLPADTVKRPWSYEVEATVTDTDRQQVAGRSRVDVHVAEAYVGVRGPGGLATAGKPVTVQIVAVTPAGEARRGTPVKLTAVRREWDVVREKGMDGTWRWVNSVKDEPVAAGTVQSAAQVQSWTFTPAEGGYYVVRAEGPGIGGATTVAETGVYALGGEVSWARSDTRTLELVPDRKTYRPGETAKVLVKAPKTGMRALVTVEREGVWSRRVVTLSSTAEALELPITAEMMPNAYVTVLAVEGAPPALTPDAGKPGIWYGVAEIAVEAAAQRIAVALTTDREAYQPGDSVRIHLEAQRDGQALADAAVTLWAVDYGVLSLTAYETPDLHEEFYRARPLGVLTADNRISVYDRAHYLSKGAEAGGGGGQADGDTRRRFETTPLWTRLRTDARGVLDHTFELPDNLTTFRIMAVVQDRRAAFGSADREVRVNRPLIARPALPRFFREGDRVMAGVVVHNNTPAAVEVQVQATAQGATLKGAPRTVEVPADGAQEVPFALTGFAGPAVALRFEATGGGNRDAVELSVPVSSPLPQEVVATSGSTTAEARETVAMPAGAIPTVGGLTVDVSASALVGMGSAVDYLLDYPHGCLEQIGSRTRVALLARTLGSKAGVATPREKLDEYVRAGLSQLETFRTAEGGYGYWPGDEATGPASAYALELLAEAKAAGETVDAANFDRLAAYVRAFVAGEHVPRWWTPEMTRAAQARAALSLARAGRGDAGFNARLWDARGELPLFGKAQLLETLARTTGGDARTRALSEQLAAAVHVEATSASLVEREKGRWEALWYGDGLGTAALVRAWMQAAPTHPMLERLVRSLVAARTQGRWANTYTTAEALHALRDYTTRYETGAVTARVSLAGQPLLEKALGEAGQARSFVPMTGLKPGELLLAASGGRLYYESRLAYAVPSLPPRDEGFTLSRTYEVLEGTGGGAQVSPGAVVRVTLRAVTPVDRYNVALVDWLPAGLEPVDTTFATTARTGGGRDTGWTPRDTGIFADEGPHEWASTWIFNRRELRDDRVALYADYMPAGIHVQSYLARATTPGDYAHPAATVEQMYAPDVYGRTEAGRFVVGWPVAAK